MIVEAREAFQFDTVEDVLREIAKGNMVIVTDDADRENEGDLVMAAEKVTRKSGEFHGDARTRADLRARLEQSRRTTWLAADGRAEPGNVSNRFHRFRRCGRGVTTGISAHDRAATIKTIANPKSSPDDLVQPGHVFPLRAMDGGVLRRAGHTEAAVDLATMSGLQPAGVLCEILHDDGTMARLPELMEFRKKHGLRICTIQSLIAHRRMKEKLVERNKS